MSIFTKFSFKIQYRYVRCQKKMMEFVLKTNFIKCYIVTSINYIFSYSIGIASSEISTLYDIPIHQIYKFLKNIQIAVYENDIRCHRRIGGLNLTVEIDESQMEKRKNNVGCIPNHKIIFGGICRENKEIFMKIIEICQGTFRKRNFCQC
ncbi:hypothetical protein H312_01035 [Anncaliia algerae PRA339]|uniref:Uncharacterized protein n=1 Tax=Anncaliia algerae PRA339 TaxID=1288291 RepID=A0A059F333_9MICR|nr:hypothetical protein H312_01035 [Anncaliia algerae PRA339]